ncbi:hypothetical protein [Haloarcula sp. 1CSR25-25]|uniref:hypothetical protein n=1 Tax=Haloarcula sp. 1CSR25-25 TaxID=2862545 RepID=UPI002893C889|nr:hypothetical protein [Haloarcula sp. 1CSR25-25]MDT3436069.1 hypothetical protein [Haloarcula sp. 1CSR25-25]
MGDDNLEAAEDAREELQSLLVVQAQAGVPEQILVGILREQTAEIERLGTSPHRWEQPDQQEVSQR